MRPLTLKQELFVKHMYSPDSDCKGNSLESARRAGYKGNSNTLGQIGHKLVNNGKIKEAKNKLLADVDRKIEHNRKIAIDKLTTDFKYLDKQAEQGNIQAIQARTSIIRELDAISSLHSQRIDTGAGDKLPELTDQEREWYKEFARFKAEKERQKSIKLSKQGS